MKTRFIVAQRFALGSALVLVGGLGAGPRAQQPTGAPPAKHSVVQERTEPKMEKTEVSLPVTGLTKDNLAAVETALRGLQHTSYDCAKCKVSETKAGNCKGCGGTLAKTEKAALQKVMASSDDSTLTLDVAPGQKVQLSEIEKVLSASKVSAPKEKLTLPTQTNLVLDGVSSEMASRTVEKALVDSKLFHSVELSMDPNTKQYLAHVSRGTTAVNLAKVSALLTKALPEAKIADLSWSGPTPLHSAGG